MPRELPIPPAAETDEKAVELVRVWAAHGAQHVTLATEIWQDPAAWGILLVDLAKHIANAYQQSEGRDFVSVLQRLREGFDAEWGHSTDEPTGQIP
jgi:Domain of unknown function (DUF5076)